jgi:hypothetical protein
MNTKPILVDCGEYYENLPIGYSLKGVKTIYINDRPVQTFCTEDGWTVIQSRGQFGYPKDFFSEKLWTDYVAGFGTPGKAILFYIIKVNLNIAYMKSSNI